MDHFPPATPPRQVINARSAFLPVTPDGQLMAPHHRLAPGTPPGESMIPVSNYWKTPSVYGTPSSSFCIVPGSCQRSSTPLCNWTEGDGGELDTTHCATAAQDPSTRTQVANEMVHGAGDDALIHRWFQSPPRVHEGTTVLSVNEVLPLPPTAFISLAAHQGNLEVIDAHQGNLEVIDAPTSHGTSIAMIA